MSGRKSIFVAVVAAFVIAMAVPAQSGWKKLPPNFGKVGTKITHGDGHPCPPPDTYKEERPSRPRPRTYKPKYPKNAERVEPPKQKKVSPRTQKPAVETFTVKGVRFEMVRIDGGKFSMGSDFEKDEMPVHQDSVKTFYLGRTEVTQALWEAVMKENPSKIRGANLPVESVSWKDCKEFISRLNRLTGRKFRLPTETEWEYAARGGKYSDDFTYSGSDEVGRIGWFAENSDSTIHAVGQKLDNELGLYDMSGNVWEWCSSSWRDDYSSSKNNKYRVLRGGSYLDKDDYLRVSNRAGNATDCRYHADGLRLAL